MDTVYNNLAEAINDLTKRGYSHNFNAKEDCIICQGNNMQLQPDEFEIEGVFRFQEMSDVGDESVLYAISSKISDLKGLLVNAYGTYADSASAKMIKKLEVR